MVKRSWDRWVNEEKIFSREKIRKFSKCQNMVLGTTREWSTKYHFLTLRDILVKDGTWYLIFGKKSGTWYLGRKIWKLDDTGSGGGGGCQSAKLKIYQNEKWSTKYHFSEVPSTTFLTLSQHSTAHNHSTLLDQCNGWAAGLCWSSDLCSILCSLVHQSISECVSVVERQFGLRPWYWGHLVCGHGREAIWFAAMVERPFGIEAM